MFWDSSAAGFGWLLCLLCLVPARADADAALLCLERLSLELAPSSAYEELPAWHEWLERRAARGGASAEWLDEPRPHSGSGPGSWAESREWARAGVHLIRADNFWADGGLTQSMRSEIAAKVRAELGGEETGAEGEGSERAGVYLDLRVALDGLESACSGLGDMELSTPHQWLLQADCLAEASAPYTKREVALSNALTLSDAKGPDWLYGMTALSEVMVRRGELPGAVNMLKDVVVATDKWLERPLGPERSASVGEVNWFKRQALIRLMTVLPENEALCLSPRYSGLCGEVAVHPISRAVARLQARRRSGLALEASEPNAEDAPAPVEEFLLSTLLAEQWQEAFVVELKQLALERIERLLSSDSGWMDANEASTTARTKLLLAIDLLRATGRGVGLLSPTPASGGRGH